MQTNMKRTLWGGAAAAAAALVIGATTPDAQPTEEPSTSNG